ncbi:MAG: hypothetical protein AAFV85_24730 [Cyanobacteria bacterium J06634_6]
MNSIPVVNNKTSNNRPLVCVIGTFRSLELTHKNLIEKVIKPLNADVMFCVTRLSSDDEDNLDYFKDCNIVDVCLYEDSKQGYEVICDSLSEKLNPKHKSTWREYLTIPGNWLGGMKGKEGSGMHLTYNFWKLLQRLQYLKAKGNRYERFVITRTDLFWLKEHPPLKLLSPSLVWIPSGQDYLGYNDRHAVCSDKNIRQYLNLLELMINLQARDFLNYEKEVNHEKHLKCHLDYSGVGIGRFKSLAYLTGTKTSLTNWSSVENEVIDGKEYAYKYKAELLDALRHSRDFDSHRDYAQMLLRPLPIKELTRLVKMKLKYKYLYAWELLQKLRGYSFESNFARMKD